MKRYQAAFDRLDRIRKKAGRQEFWLERRGQILDLAGRVAEAQVCYEAALVTSQSRAPRLRNTQSSQELEGRLRQKLNLPASTRKGGC